MTQPSPRTQALANWLFAPIALAATAVGVATVLRGPGWMLGTTLALVVGGVFLWIFVSVFWPSRADKTCPRCGEDALRRLDEGSTRGVACAQCGYTDDTASSFYLAEESDEPMEPMLLEDRAARANSRKPAREREMEATR